MSVIDIQQDQLNKFKTGDKNSQTACIFLGQFRQRRHCQLAEKQDILHCVENFAMFIETSNLKS